MANWVIRSASDKVLEPSCGDGNLLVAVTQVLKDHGASPDQIALQVNGIELDPQEAQKARQRLESVGVHLNGQLREADFFTVCRDVLLGHTLLNDQPTFYDAVIGNPPFIRYQSFPDSFRNNAFDIMHQVGLHPSRLTNIWVPFLVASALTLNDKGRLAMIIPAELLQVSYAEEVRQFLSRYFSEITLITFRNLVFDDAQQEVVLLLCERQPITQHHIRILEVDDVNDLESHLQNRIENANGHKVLKQSKDKWTRYLLTPTEIDLLDTVANHPLVVPSTKYFDVNVGVVTGNNDFFLLTESQREKHKIEDVFLKRIVSRSAHLLGNNFQLQDWSDNASKDFPVYLLYSDTKVSDVLSDNIHAYIKHGEQLEINKGYKCRIRPRWYQVPSVWTPDAFILRQVHKYPKLILNNAGATCTDTIHRVRFREGVDGKKVAAAFCNSMTFAFSEVTGRSYGGGVLTFEPSESRNLAMTLQGVEHLDTCNIDTLLRKNQIETVLDETDRVLLKEGLGLSNNEIRLLRQVWEKLRDRRINRKSIRKRK